MRTKLGMLMMGALAMMSGCGSSSGEAAKEVTWHQDIAPLAAKHCTSCHESGGPAPFALDSYELAKPLAGAMLAAVDAGTMPPWLARETATCNPTRPWKDDLRLSAEEIDTLRAWVESGTLEGDPSNAAPLPNKPQLTIADPTKSIAFPVPYVVDGDKDDFQCIVLDPGNTEKVWVTAAQLRPGNPLVDHHAIIFVDTKGASTSLIEQDSRFPCFNTPDVAGYPLATWVPGAAPFFMPETSGVPIPAGAKIVVQMHYHPTGKGPELDQSTLDLVWTTEQPLWDAAQALLGNFDNQHADGSELQPGPNDGAAPEFRIPANVSGHVETMIYRHKLPLNIAVFSASTHMHYVGVDMQIDFKNKAEETEECLLQTPNWNFNWQRVYNFDVPIEKLPTIHPGDELVLRCTYDNTLNNPFVAKALADQGIPQPQEVLLGEETVDEMCLGLFGLLVPPGTLDFFN